MELPRFVVLLTILSLGLGCSPADENSAPGGAECPAPSGSGTEHQATIEADETWTAEGSPHVVTFNMSVRGATLTLEPCAVVRIRKGYMISVGGSTGADGAAIVAHGEVVDGVDRPIRFERDDPDQPWGSLFTFATGTLDLERVHLEGGGDPDSAQNNGGTVIGLGEGGTTGMTKNVRLVDVTIAGSGGFGVNLQSRSGFTDDSANLVITGSGSLPPGGNSDVRYPVSIEGPAVSTVPEGTYTGNALDAIQVANASSLRDAEIVFRDRGVPYDILNGFSMAPEEPSGLSTLTIDPGVVIRFDNIDSSNIWAMTLGTSNGDQVENIWPVRLVAPGTEAAPIVFTSRVDPPLAGNWGGIKWSGGPATGNVMSHVRVEYAGGPAGTTGFGCGPRDNDAALIITNWRPDDAFITDSVFADSAAGGIVRGWNSEADGPDLVATNTFTRIGNGCNVSRWADGDGSCPLAPPICE